MRSAYETPPELCPYCGAKCEAEWTDVGVGMVQTGPYWCGECFAVQAGPYDKPRPDYDAKTGWYKPKETPDDERMTRGPTAPPSSSGCWNWPSSEAQ